MEPTVDQKLLRIACHEAAHVVVGWVCGHKIGAAWIKPQVGRACVGEPGSCSREEEALVAVAGGIGADLSGVEMFNENEVYADECMALAYITKIIRAELDLDNETDDDLVLAQERLTPLRNRAAFLIQANAKAKQLLACFWSGSRSQVPSSTSC